MTLKTVREILFTHYEKWFIATYGTTPDKDVYESFIEGSTTNFENAMREAQTQAVEYALEQVAKKVKTKSVQEFAHGDIHFYDEIDRQGILDLKEQIIQDLNKP